ncbi:phospholipase D family protein [Nonomuraea jabiensis]|uniref:Phosphatidylserine/phosphatidylglycerophosphate/ cardiolipin synthase-like enzyme n=1 Tax=Nonomuraea jabiensis TaxID=882448 RepID=A0A7W9GFY0_9ACTN|nr:phospholipase D-like domain-containing protein [Nonomuraea jabiensis]MBB5783022.1 phosphatidylserine/phosphatidylglycerophosphate/cardiolipin synthase-like enzyme [Nonomuraea jabiensis]
MRLDDWFLTGPERGNDATKLEPWTEGNLVRPLVHGATYFAELAACLAGLGKDDLLLFTDWRGDPDERLTPDGPGVAAAMARAAERGALVRGLIWRSHLDFLRFSSAENRHLGEEIEAAGGQALLDTRVRRGGSHHQKFVVLRHDRRDNGGPDRDVAFVGGIDLCHSRRDDAEHLGDPQAAPMPGAYGDRPPWHDVQVAIRGPAVAEVEKVFCERWEDPAPETRQPFRRLRDRLSRMADVPPLPEPGPAPAAAGTHAVQLLRTYPHLRHAYPFAPEGERSVARAYRKVLTRARSLVYLEDQYLWSTEVIEPFAQALEREPGLRMIIVVPRHPDQDGWLAGPASLIGRSEALARLMRAGDGRVAIYDLENHRGTPVYVHAKVCVVDDVWASVGSDNVNLRSWTFDSELSCAVLDAEPDPRPPSGARRFARELRLTLAAEHLDRDPGDLDDLLDPESAYEAFAESAARLEAWHRDGCRGPRPPGRLRPHPRPGLGRVRRALAMPLYRSVVDPDGRPARLRRSNEF